MLVGITVIDVDGFKQINDTFGHETGDECLKEIGRRLKGLVRVTDAVARLGGDEFVFIACECRPIADLELAMKRLVVELSQRWIYGEADLNPSVSCGVAVFPANGATMTQLLVAADAAMYQAKRQGKNRVVFADSFFKSKSEWEFEQAELEGPLAAFVRAGEPG